MCMSQCSHPCSHMLARFSGKGSADSVFQFQFQPIHPISAMGLNMHSETTGKESSVAQARTAWLRHSLVRRQGVCQIITMPAMMPDACGRAGRG